MTAGAVWDPSWLEDHSERMSMNAFRMVETQHIAATMRLVDSAEEQSLLEQMLEISKPPLPPHAEGLYYLLAAPFRYLPPLGSRFRRANAPGIWYGANDRFCACAEVAYWRQRFVLDSVGLLKESLSTEHSMYEAHVSELAIDLTSVPWSQTEHQWLHPSDYTETQRLGQVVRDHSLVTWIRYGSVRAPGYSCAAVFDPRGLTMVTTDGRYEQWHCHTTRDKVTFSNGQVRFDF